MNRLLFILLSLFTSQALAQTTSCIPGTAEAVLDTGLTSARILNNGNLFWNEETHLYETPKGEGIHSIFNASVWVGGVVNGEIRAAATQYGPYEFAPGPLDAAGNAPPDCAAYDQIWEITAEDINQYLRDGIQTENLQNWPWQLGAPVIDGDGDPNNFNLNGGDLPELLGDQRLWWIMNDRGVAHNTTGSTPIGLEVHGSAFAFRHPGFMGNDTFYTYRLINKNTAPLSDAYFSVFADADLGNFGDDVIGSDSLVHLGYTYNGDNNDDGLDGYGVAPPAIGIAFLRSAIKDADGIDNDRDGVVDNPGEMVGASSFMVYNHRCDVCDPENTPQTHYFAMQARWTNGDPLTLGGYGWGFSNHRILFLYPGDPATGNGWSEFNLDPIGQSYPMPGDRRMLISSGPFTLAAGDSLDMAFAIISARGNSNFDSVTELRKEARQIRKEAATLLRPVFSRNVASPVATSASLGFAQNFPNPFSQTTTLRYAIPQTMHVRLAVHDMLGREVALLVDAQQEAGTYDVSFNAGTLPAGVYLARIQLDVLQHTQRMTLHR